MDTLTLVANLVIVAINLAVLAFQLRKEWQTRHEPTTHPLEASLRDIAQAIRMTGETR